MVWDKNKQLISLIQSSLQEDLGKKDITTELLIPKENPVKAVILAKDNGIVCGLNVARLVFKIKDKRIRFKPWVKDGEYAKRGSTLAELWGESRRILTAERVALNFLSLLSGIATKTREFVETVKPYKVKIMDTRKTIPGLRQLQKYAVKIGGGFNHRFSLDEMVMVKDNHWKIINHKSPLFNLKKRLSQSIKVEIEVRDLKEFREVFSLKPDIIMLDNMSRKDISKAVQIRNELSSADYGNLVKLEASGKINLKNVKAIASTGVEMISLGTLTHSVKSIDMSLEIVG